MESILAVLRRVGLLLCVVGVVASAIRLRRQQRAFLQTVKTLDRRNVEAELEQHAIARCEPGRITIIVAMNALPTFVALFFATGFAAGPDLVFRLTTAGCVLCGLLVCPFLSWCADIRRDGQSVRIVSALRLARFDIRRRTMHTESPEFQVIQDEGSDKSRSVPVLVVQNGDGTRIPLYRPTPFLFVWHPFLNEDVLLVFKHVLEDWCQRAIRRARGFK